MPNQEEILNTMFDRIDILDDDGKTRHDIDDIVADDDYDGEDEYYNEVVSSGDYYSCHFDDPDEIDDEDFV